MNWTKLCDDSLIHSVYHNCVSKFCINYQRHAMVVLSKLINNSKAIHNWSHKVFPNQIIAAAS